MKRSSYSRQSKASYPRPQRKSAPRIKLTAEHPELDVNHVVNVILRKGLRPVPPKASVSLRLDADVLDWFRSRGRGYQTRINAVLRAFKDASA